MRTLKMREYLGFYSSEILPPFLVAHVISLQDSFLRNPKRGGQVIILWKAHGFKVLLQESSNALPYSYWALYFIRGSTQRMGSSFLWPNGHRSVRPTRLGPSGLVFCFYPLQLPPSPHLVRRFQRKGANWGDSQINPDGLMFMGRRMRHRHERRQI